MHGRDNGLAQSIGKNSRSNRPYFAKLKEFRFIATRYDKTDESFSANINLAAALIAAR